MQYDSQDVIRLLRLRPLEIEGGWFRETYRSAVTLTSESGSSRSLATAIFYLLTSETFSEIHRLPGDEVFHFYLGDRVEMVQLFENGSVRRIILGNDLAAGEQIQVVVPGGVWQGARLAPGGKFALLGTTMSPGFSYDDYERGDRVALIRDHPGAAAEIEILTKPSD